MRLFALTLNAFDKAYRENEEVVYWKGGQRRVNKAPTGAANTVVTIVASRNLSQRLTAVMEATFDAMKEKAIAPPQRLLAHRMVEEGAEGQEGCEISGRVELARVPVQLRVVAEAHHQTIAASWLNMSHLVRSLLSPRSRRRRRSRRRAAARRAAAARRPTRAERTRRTTTSRRLQTRRPRARRCTRASQTSTRAPTFARSVARPSTRARCTPPMSTSSR